MDRLISADVLMDAVMKQPVVDKSVAKRLIAQSPTVDAVQVVRCGECVYRRRCMLQHFVESNAVDSTKIDWSEWYCADGVRENDADS